MGVAGHDPFQRDMGATDEKTLRVVLATDSPGIGGGSSGTSSTFGAAVPATGTAVGFSDGTNMQPSQVFDADSGAGTQYVLGAILRASANGGSVEAGTSTNPLRTDPTGTTTQPTNVAQINGVTPLMGAGNTGTGSLRVTVASDQATISTSQPDTRPSSSTITVQDTGSSTTTGQNNGSIVTGTPTASSFQTQAINGNAGAAILISGVWTGTLALEVSSDGGTTYSTRTMQVAGTSFRQGSVTGNGLFTGEVSGSTQVRVRATAAMTGTATVQMAFSQNTGVVKVNNPISIFDNSTGSSLSITGGIANANVSQLAGTTTDTNSGNKSAGTLRVVLATDQPALTNKLLVTPDANSAVNVSQVNGVTPLMGNGATGTGSMRVTLASDNTANSNPFLIAGAAAHGASVSGNPLLQGCEARDTLGTAVATGQTVREAANRYGALLISAFPPSHASSNGTPITTTTTSVVAAPAASSHLRVVRFTFSNGGSTSTWVAIRDGAAGTQHYRVFLAQGATVSLDLNQSGPLDLTTATRLDIVLSAAGSVEYEVDYLTVAD